MEEERQLLLQLIDRQLAMLAGRLGPRGDEQRRRLIALRRKLEGVDKRIVVQAG